MRGDDLADLVSRPGGAPRAEGDGRCESAGANIAVDGGARARILPTERRHPQHSEAEHDALARWIETRRT